MSGLPAHARIPPRHAVAPWLLVATALVLFRTVPYAWWGTLAFDADQAVVGLMAKHVAEFRALPVYQYALSYVVMLTAYVAAPVMWVLGATVFALKLPLVLMNVAVGLTLVLAMVRAGVRPAAATLLSLPVLMTSGVSNAGLMDALGMTIEPLLFVVVLWQARHAPIVFGVGAALGFHVREFVAYGVAALLAVDLVSGAWLSREGRRHWVIVALAALATSALVGGVARYASIRGPDTWIAGDMEGNLATLGGAFCFAPAQAWRNVVDLAASYLGLLWGAAPLPLSRASVQTRVAQGLPWAWPVIGSVLLVLGLRLLLLWRRAWQQRRTPMVQLGAFLALVGSQSVLVYAISRCGPLSVITVRYALLGVFLPTGLGLLVWALEPRVAMRRTLAAALLALAAINIWTHGRLWHEQVTTPIVSTRAQLGPALEAEGIRYARSDYWTAYYVVFMTNERVIVGADGLSRIDVYERILAQHPEQVVRISPRPCGAAPPIAPGFYVCRDAAP